MTAPPLSSFLATSNHVFMSITTATQFRITTATQFSRTHSLFSVLAISSFRYCVVSLLRRFAHSLHSSALSLYRCPFTRSSSPPMRPLTKSSSQSHPRQRATRSTPGDHPQLIPPRLFWGLLSYCWLHAYYATGWFVGGKGER